MHPGIVSTDPGTSLRAVAKLMGVFVDMDNLVGKDFATGLASMKAIAER